MNLFRITVWVRKDGSIGEFYIREFEVECSIDNPTDNLLMSLWRDKHGDKWESRSGVVKRSGAFPLSVLTEG